MNREKLETWKQKYKKDWAKFKDLENGEKLFYEWAKAKEKLKKTKEKLKAQSEKERKREARALIIFAKLILQELNKEKLENIIYMNHNKFIQKERKEFIDYSKYILKLLQEEKEKNTIETKPTNPEEQNWL